MLARCFAFITDLVIRVRSPFRVAARISVPSRSGLAATGAELYRGTLEYSLEVLDNESPAAEPLVFPPVNAPRVRP